MKIRTSFVTNSSSSSFVIAYKSFDELRSIGEQYPQIKQLLDFYNSFVSGGKETIKTKEDLDNMFVDYYGGRDQTIEEVLEDDKWLQQSYDKYLKAIQEGYTIVEKVVDNSDEFTGEFLRSVEDGVNMILLEEGEC